MPEPQPHAPSAAPAAGVAPLGLEELAARVGRYQWVEARLFELLGGWVPTIRELEVKLAVAEHAHHHAWHAELWEERLPRLAHLERDALVAPPAAGAADVVTALGADHGDAGATAARLVGVYRVLLPRLVATYAAHLRHVSPATDAPVARVLRLVLADEMEDWRVGESLLQSLLTTPAAVEAATATQGRLEAALVADAGLLGAGDVLRAPVHLPPR